MRALLGILLCFSLLQSQVYALSGGPVYDRVEGDDAVKGFYSGSMRAHKVSPDDGTSEPNYIPAMGLFQATVADNLVGNGDYAVFNQGVVSFGFFTMTVSPSGKLDGIFDGESLNGTVSAKRIKRSSDRRSVVTARLRGTANILSKNPIFETIEFKVSGYQTTDI